MRSQKLYLRGDCLGQQRTWQWQNTSPTELACTLHKLGTCGSIDLQKEPPYCSSVTTKDKNAEERRKLQQDFRFMLIRKSIE